METNNSGSEMTQMNTTDGGVKAVSSLKGSNPPLKFVNVDYHSPPSDSSSPYPHMTFEPHSKFRDSFASRTAHKNAQSQEGSSSRDASTVHRGVVLSLMSRVRSRSPIYRYSQPPVRHNSIPINVTDNRRLRSDAEAGSSRDFSTDRRRSALPVPRSRSRSPADKSSEHVCYSSSSDVGDDENRLRSCFSPAEQLSSCKKHHRHHQQHQQPTGSSSSMMFNKKLAKLRELR